MESPDPAFWEEEENCRKVKGKAKGSIEANEALKWWSRFSQSHLVYNAEIEQIGGGTVGNNYEISFEYEKRTGVEEGEMKLDCFSSKPEYQSLLPVKRFNQNLI